MATLAQVMAGAEAVLNGITATGGRKLRASDVSPGQTTPPFAVVGLPPIDYRLTMGRGKASLDFSITVGTSAAHDRAGQLLLAEFADRTGTGSLVAAFEADPTLGATVDQAAIFDFRPLGLEEVGELGYFGGLFTLRVLANGI
jgi:hypothetical protein